jgi:hypothetical protein
MNQTISNPIQKELVSLGLWEHWRQNFAKVGPDIGFIRHRAAVVLKKHLEISDEFFYDPAVQADEIKRIVDVYYQKLMAA